MELWPHQLYAKTETLAALARGERKLLLTSPTGGGKSRIACEIIDHLAADGWYCVLYTNRKLLVDQLVKVLSAHGIDFGVRAADWSDEGRFEPVQISSLPTERSRVLNKGTWQVHGTGRKCLALVDEAHLHDNDTARRLFALHDAQGHARLGITATPLGLGDLYERLIVAGITSELRACGALVPCIHYGCDEPDLKDIAIRATGEDLSEKQIVKAIMRNGIFGRVLEWFFRINPSRRPSLLFAPGVAESVWFAEQFMYPERRDTEEERALPAVTAAHIDGEAAWVNGEWHRNDWKIREQIIEGSREGRICVICNRFVMREGVDLPWISHGIFATVFGGVQSYLQSGGRLLRNHPSLTEVTLQDHGGNWWRHGSLNADRQWNLGFTQGIVAGMREDAFRAKKVPEPALCPKCHRALMGSKCLSCGHIIPLGQKSRPVVMQDGTLHEQRGDIYRRRPTMLRPNTPGLWQRMYYRAKAAGMTFRQARGLFLHENFYVPPETIPLMPTQELDWYRQVSEVEPGRLTS